MKRHITTCPHCGNSNPDQRESNATGWSNRDDSDETYLCTNRVTVGSVWWDVSPEDIGSDGKVTCGTQWPAYEWDDDE